MKLLILSRYDRLGASSRLRLMQYLPYLTETGFEVEVASFFDAAYLKAMYSGQPTGSGILRYFIQRLQQMRAARSADLIWVEKEALPWIPWPIERLFFPRQIPIVSDYDDAVFHRYDMHRRAAVRHLLGSKIDQVMRHSQIVFAGNNYLMEHALAAGAPRVEFVPTVVDIETYDYCPNIAPDKKPRIGWVGTPNTWAAFGKPMIAMLQNTITTHGAVFRAVGAGRPDRSVPGFEFPDWSEDREISLIQGMDIGIMPLPDTPWARGKCGYKLIQNMACGLPVVASPVGVNREIVEHGVNGFLAKSDTDWYEALSTLLADPELRRRMGAAGRAKVEAEYSIQVLGPKVARTLRGLVAKASQG